MLVAFLKIIPIILSFLTGFLFKKLKIFDKNSADQFFKLLYYLGFPAFAFQSLLKVDLSIELVLFPLSAGILISVGYFIGILTEKLFKLPKKTRGVYIVASMIVNSGFTFPFILAIFGEAGVARCAFFDLVNATLIFTWVYAIACTHNEENLNRKEIIKKLLFSPTLWATILGVAFNIFHISVSPVLLSFVKEASGIVPLLMMFSLGLYFEPKLVRPKPLVTVICSRMAVGLAIGVIIVAVTGMSGIDRQILLLLAASPVGINTIIFSSLENLDNEFAASVTSYSILIALFTTPLLIIFLTN